MHVRRGTTAAAGWVAALTAGTLCAPTPPASAAPTPAPAPPPAASVTASTSAVSLARTPFRVTVAAKVRRGAPGARTVRRGWSTLGAVTVASATPSPVPVVGGSSRPLPTFSKSFTTNGSTYRYTMVGTDPWGPPAITTVPNVLAPVSLRFGGQTIAPSAGTIAAVTSSGLFTPRAFPGATGQYGDAFARTQFWSALGNGTKNWHVLLDAPTVAPWLVLDVPSTVGAALLVNGIRVAAVDVDWFDARVQDAVTAQSPGTLTQLLAGNVVLCKPFTAGRYDTCGIAGYHSATRDDVGTHTYSYQSYLHGSVFGATTGFHDLGPMSHELAEWFADPFLDNVVPAWRSDLAPQYGCLDELETGDPVVGRFLTVDGLTYQDEAYLWWFSRTSPSPAWQRRYTWLNTFTTFSPSCTPT